MEFGWPYELGFTFERGSMFQIVCQGGLVNRIEDLSILYGIAFRAKGFAQIGGTVGGRSFGASVLARADFSIDAKFIAYLSIKRFNDTLFYGSLAFDVSISLQVRVWLEFSVGFTDIHLEIGFSLSLTLSIALEVAVSPRSIGGRAAASVGVGAFGRSIRLGIGFGFNEGALNTARSRVERFLALGLTVATPDAEQGVAPPAPEQPRGPASRDADQVVDHALEKHEEITAQPADAKPKGRDLEPTGYWAMLFPVGGRRREVRDGLRAARPFRDRRRGGPPAEDERKRQAARHLLRAAFGLRCDRCGCSFPADQVIARHGDQSHQARAAQGRCRQHDFTRLRSAPTIRSTSLTTSAGQRSNPEPTSCRSASSSDNASCAPARRSAICASHRRGASRAIPSDCRMRAKRPRRFSPRRGAIRSR